MAERECRAVVSERSSGLCEVRFESVCRGVAESKHHRRKQGQGGKWVPSNIVDICGDGTTGCHGFIEANPVSAKRRGLWLYAGQHPLMTPAYIVWRGTTEWCLLDDEGSVNHLSRRAFDRLKEAM